MASGPVATPNRISYTARKRRCTVNEIHFQCFSNKQIYSIQLSDDEDYGIQQVLSQAGVRVVWDQLHAPQLVRVDYQLHHVLSIRLVQLEHAA